MEQFKYKAKSHEGGKVQSGSVEARDIRQAASVLRERGLVVVELSPIRRPLHLMLFSSFFSRVKFSDIVNFTRQLSTMITAGLPLSESLALLESQVPVGLSKVVSEVLVDVEGGKSLGDAFEKHPQVFNTVYVSLVRAGEAAGKLDEMLARLADNLEKEREFRAKTKGAMIYPIIIVVGMILVTVIMMIFVIPKLTQLYDDFGAQLPFATRLLVMISKFVSRFWYMVLIAGFGAGWFFRLWKATPIGRRALDAFVFRIPVYGNLRREVLLAEFCRTLGLLTGAGVSIVDGLNIVSDTMPNQVYADSIRETAKRVEKGLSVASTIALYPHFPAILSQMLSVGEETGKVDEVLLKLATYFETESEHLIKGLTTAIEPLIMVFLGIGVGFLVISVIMPIYNLTSQM